MVYSRLAMIFKSGVPLMLYEHYLHTKVQRARIVQFVQIHETLVFERKTLEDTEEDVGTFRIFAWKTQIHYYE